MAKYSPQAPVAARSDRDETLGRSNRLISLAAGVAVIIGITILTALALTAWALGWDGFWRGMGQPYATTLAALAAVIAGAIALHNNRSQLAELRAQRQLEQARWEDQKAREETKDLRARFSESTSQLAHANGTVRRSGAYAMVALANDWRALGDESEAKVCIGVLGAYLSTPNAYYTESPKPDAGDDGPVRAHIVALLSDNSVPNFKDLRGSRSLLDGADLRGVRFTMPLRKVDFSGADLRGAKMVQIALNGALFISADLREANLLGAELRGADLTLANLAGASLFDADLTEAVLESADLEGADLEHAKLEKASLRWADLRDADLRDTDLGAADTREATFDDRTKFPDGFTVPSSIEPSSQP